MSRARRVVGPFPQPRPRSAVKPFVPLTLDQVPPEIREAAARVFQHPADDAYWERLCSQNPRDLAKYDEPVYATFTLGHGTCAFCGEETDGPNACKRCETSLDPDLDGWI